MKYTADNHEKLRELAAMLLWTLAERGDPDETIERRMWELIGELQTEIPPECIPR